LDKWLGPFVDKTVQCWDCPIFDRLFQIISSAAAAMYDKMVVLCIIIFAIVIAFYVLWAVTDNMGLWKAFGGKAPEVQDHTYQTYFKPVLINGLIVMSLFSLGVWFPRFVTTVTIEPVADITIMYTQAVIGQTPESVAQKVTYEPEPMKEDGFYRPALRDKIVMLIKTSITQFQAMMKLGLAVMDNAFSWKALLGIGSLLKHIMMFFMGWYLVYGFFKLFVKYSFYFLDAVVALTFFAFFFPISLVVFVFKNSKAANWVKTLGEATGKKLLKKVINSIVTLATAIITFIIAMVLIAKFFAAQGASGTELAHAIMDGSVYSGNLSDDNLAAMTLVGSIVLLYLVTYLTDQVKKISETIMKTFDIQEEKSIGEQAGTDAEKMFENIKNIGKNVGGKLANAISGKPPAAPAGGGTP